MNRRGFFGAIGAALVTAVGARFKLAPALALTPTRLRVLGLSDYSAALKAHYDEALKDIVYTESPWLAALEKMPRADHRCVPVRIAVDEVAA